VTQGGVDGRGEMEENPYQPKGFNGADKGRKLIAPDADRSFH
jgi:hypothetical protein